MSDYSDSSSSSSSDSPSDSDDSSSDHKKKKSKKKKPKNGDDDDELTAEVLPKLKAKQEKKTRCRSSLNLSKRPKGECSTWRQSLAS